MTRFVLDAWAILALLQKEEPAASRVRALFDRASEGEVTLFLSIINLGEVTYRVGKVRGEAEAQETLRLIRRLPLTVLPADEEAVWAAVGFKTRLAISYADAFAVAAAAHLGATLVTGDPELDLLAGEVEILRLERRA
jgi:predicted nucleic acid-binding protein